mmetsp:Transcript_37579/g.70061  ORF Transcript_37579/g.70061 Transcript_37579/m.70061 type:complete len:221 (-) Transcript_37579:107-769(-)
MVSEPTSQEYQAAAGEVARAEAHAELARKREEVLRSLGSWCQMLKEIQVLAPALEPGDPKETAVLQARLRDEMFVDICNVLAFPAAAALAQTAAKPVSQRQVSKSAPLVVRTPRTPQKVQASLSESQKSLTGSTRPTPLTPRQSPWQGTPGRKEVRPAQPSMLARQRSAQIKDRLERPVTTRSSCQFQMPAFAGVRRSSSPRSSGQPASARGASGRLARP